MYVSIGPSQDEPLTAVAVSAASGGTIGAVVPAAGQVVRVYKLFLVVGGTTNITFEDGSTVLSGPLPMVANGSLVLNSDGTPWFVTSAGTTFNIVASGSVQVSGTVYYTTSAYR